MKKWVLTVIAVLSLAAVLIGGNWAWLVDKTGPLTNRFTAGTVRVEINEHGFTDVSGWSSGVAAEKKISAKSKGSKASYVRISLTPVWGTETGGAVSYTHLDVYKRQGQGRRQQCQRPQDQRQVEKQRDTGDKTGKTIIEEHEMCIRDRPRKAL